MRCPTGFVTKFVHLRRAPVLCPLARAGPRLPLAGQANVIAAAVLPFVITLGMKADVAGLVRKLNVLRYWLGLPIHRLRQKEISPLLRLGYGCCSDSGVEMDKAGTLTSDCQIFLILKNILKLS